MNGKRLHAHIYAGSHLARSRAGHGHIGTGTAMHAQERALVPRLGYVEVQKGNGAAADVWLQIHYLILLCVRSVQGCASAA